MKTKLTKIQKRTRTLPAHLLAVLRARPADRLRVHLLMGPVLPVARRTVAVQVLDPVPVHLPTDLQHRLPIHRILPHPVLPENLLLPQQHQQHKQLANLKNLL